MYYKVIQQCGEDLLSAYVGNTKLGQKYKLGDFVFAPDKYPFMVFDNLRYAEKFVNSQGNSIYECMVVNPRKHHDRFVKDIVAYNPTYSYIEERYSENYTSINFLEGTVFCDGVYLTKLIYADNEPVIYSEGI